MCEELKRWAKTDLYSCSVDKQQLQTVHSWIHFLELLVRDAEKMLVLANGGLDDGLKVLLRHIKENLLEDKVVQMMMQQLEKDGHIDKADENQEVLLIREYSSLEHINLDNGQLIQWFVPERNAYLMVNRKKKVVLTEDRTKASTFVVHRKEKKKNHVVVYGFMETEKKCYLFSASPHTRALHGYYGKDLLFCRYKGFGQSEQFIFIKNKKDNDGSGLMMAFYNKKYWGLHSGLVKVAMTKDPSQALIIKPVQYNVPLLGREMHIMHT